MKVSAKQPRPTELQNLHRLYQSGQPYLAETAARKLLAKYPVSLPILNILGMCQQAQGKLQQAVDSFQKMLAVNSGIAEIHFNLAAIYTQLDDGEAAILSYRRALQIKPEFTVAHFNLGALLQRKGRLQDSARHYRDVVTQQPEFYEAWVNMGVVRQLQGDLRAAEECYRNALQLNVDARGYFNLGTALYGLGESQQAIDAFNEALRLDPHCADAWNGLGEIWRDCANMEEAVRSYREAIRIEPRHSRANYNLGESYCMAGQLLQSIPYFVVSDFADAKERILLNLYKAGRFEEFKRQLDEVVAEGLCDSVLLGSLSTHYAINFRQDNPYRFCRNPMDFVQHTEIAQLAAPDSALLKALLDDVKHLAIAERKQGRLFYGMQSAGNLLQRSEISFKELAELIRAKVIAYRRLFSECEDGLIGLFPEELEFASSWYLRMNQGGYLTSHIHTEGWISGCLYLQLPDKMDDHEGSFEYGTDGDDYPRLHDDFPKKIVDQKIGDLILFPSSLFHRTIPFHSEQERICIAFDIKPAVNRSWF